MLVILMKEAFFLPRSGMETHRARWYSTVQYSTVTVVHPPEAHDGVALVHLTGRLACGSRVECTRGS